MSSKSNATATASAGGPWLTIMLVAGLIMRFAVEPGTTWLGINVHYAGAILIVVALIPLLILLAIIAVALVVLGVAYAIDSRNRRRARKARKARLGR